MNSKFITIIDKVYNKMYSYFGTTVKIQKMTLDGRIIEEEVDGILYTQNSIVEIPDKSTPINFYVNRDMFLSKQELLPETIIYYNDIYNKEHIYKVIKKTSIGFPSLIFLHELEEVY